jgi:hypothetical protein
VGGGVGCVGEGVGCCWGRCDAGGAGRHGHDEFFWYVGFVAFGRRVLYASRVSIAELIVKYGLRYDAFDFSECLKRA